MKKLLLKMISVVCLGGIVVSQANLSNSTYNGYSDFQLKGPDIERLKYGSNYWVSSNLREWLNSSEEIVRYTGNPPSAEYVKSNPYDKEAGFLSHFTSEEQEMIAITERGNLFGKNDVAASTNGKTTTVFYNENSTKSINFNYPGVFKDWDNLGQVVTNEKIFLLTMKELTEYVQNRGWDILKNPIKYVQETYGYSSTSHPNYFVYHPVHDVGRDFLDIISENHFALDSTPYEAQGIAPALHLKKEAIVKRIKTYNPSTQTWTSSNSTLAASQLNIGDIVEFGSFNNEPLQWRVINKTESGFPLLFSENVIDIKPFDSKGDYSQRFSYIDLEYVFEKADVSTTTFQIQNIQGSSDITPVRVQVLNEDDLFTRTNNQLTLQLQLNDESGIDYILLPDGTKQSVNAKSYLLNYTFKENGYHLFGLMDVKGNFRYYVLPVGNLNLPPKVEISSSTSEWTNKDVSITIRSSTDVGYTTNSLTQSTRSLYNGSWGNYNTYAGKQIRISGKVEYVSDKNGFDASKFKFGPGLRYKRIEKNGDEYELKFTWPAAWQENLNTLKQRKLNGEEPLEFDTVLTIPNDFFGELLAANWVYVNSPDHGNFQVKWTDLKFELLDNDSFGIANVKLPSGTVINESSYTDTISTEGVTNNTYVVTATGGKTYTETITTKIDKTKPSLAVTKLTSNPLTNQITLTLKLNDNLSGLDRLETPERTISLNGTNAKELTLSLTTNDTIQLKLYDIAGNLTEETIKIPILNLTAQAKPTDNLIRLDWTNINESTYQVYQKKEGLNEFQTISMTDLSKNKQIQVLNVYPVYDGLTQQLIPLDPAFTTWDGEYINELPQSARLKQWMEAPNNEHPKGYGQGLIKVTPVSLSEFNAYTEKYIKNSDGTWKYDVIMFGSWDGNGRSEDLTDQSKLIVEQFIQDGRGVLFGHDTIMHIIKNFSDLKTYTNMKTSVEDGIEAYFNYNYAISSNNALKLKPGLLTNFPWLIEKDSLDIPISHTNLQFYCGDTWYEFNASKPEIDSSISETFGHQAVEFNGCRNNSYLSTWNNTAMIQTGHSNGQATADEQKILANTLFYLNQLSSENYLNDHSGQDVAAPIITSVSEQFQSNSSFKLTIKAIDQGSPYEYYVEANTKDGGLTLTSNIAKETITTGVKGYSYVFDTKEATEPDDTIDSTSNVIVGQLSEEMSYLHVKAIDGAGNSSTTIHIKLEQHDASLPIPVINTAEQRDHQIYVNWDVEIPQSSVFWLEDFSSKYLDLPAGNLATGIAFNANGHEIDHWGVARPLNDPIRSGVKIIDGVGLNGSRGVIVNQTAPGNGWTYSVYSGSDLPVNPTDWSGTRFSDWQKLKTDRPAIARFSTKGEGEFRINLAADWTGNGVINQYGYTWAENLTATEFKTRLENLQPIKINNPSGVQMGGFHLTTAFDYSYSYNFNLSIGNIIINNGQWYYQPTAWFGPWSDSVKPGQTVTPATNRTVEPISIGKALAQLQGTPDADNSIKISNNDWTNYSMNLYLPTSKEIADLGDYFRLMTFFKSYSQMYIDEIQIAYAPKSRLYRDGQLICEDYSVEHNDSNVQDLEAPEKVIVSTDYVNGKLKLTWEAAKDKGTLYTYEVSAVNENGKESLKSEPKVVEFISGVKEYRIYLNGSLIKTTTDLTYQFNQTITSSDRVEIGVVDQSGNETKTTLEFFELTASTQPSENMIRLDWTEVPDSIYQVFQKKEGSDEFQTISMTDLSKTKTVEVLNIYPYSTTSKYPVTTSTTFTTWKGETLTLPDSGLLKMWMETPASGYPKGYGMGIINVTPVEQDEFNEDPEFYLKNSDGTWKYNVVVNGFWDGNAFVDFTPESVQFLRQFVEEGNGYLVGHDTINGHKSSTSSYLDRVTNELRDLINVKIITDFPDGTPTIEHLQSDVIQINKKGLLINYPHQIGEIGTNLKIPKTHSTGQLAYGDIWMTFPDVDETTDINGEGTNNFYLTTYNNMALIQTGHSNGQATPDEQKVLANTLFYLNQLSTENYLNDYSAQDVASPELPVAITFESTKNRIKLTVQSTDRGSQYDYYVAATSKNGSSTMVSNITSQTITSGLAGYSYIVDTHPTTIPDTIIDTTTGVIESDYLETSAFYVHVRAIDRVGNASETLHYEVRDTINPSLKLSQKPTDWTKETVTIHLEAKDMESGVKNVTLPNGEKVSVLTTDYVVSENGTYSFIVEDYAGNRATETIKVSNIDRTAPQIKVKNLSTDWVGEHVEIQIIATDSQSGVKEIAYQLEGAMKQSWLNISNEAFVTITHSGKTLLSVRAIDEVGNERIETYEVFVDGETPEIILFQAIPK